MKPEVQALFTSIKTEDDPIEKGRLLSSLHREYDIKIKDIASYLGYTSAHVCNLMRLLKLPDLITDGYYGGNVKYTHLLLLSRLNNHEDMIELYEQILRNSISTPYLDELVRQKLYSISTKGAKIDDETRTKLENKFTQYDESAKVKIVQTRIRSRIIIDLKGDTEKTTEVLKKISEM